MKRAVSILFLASTMSLLSCMSVSAQDTRKTVAVVPATGEDVRQSIKDGITEGLLEGVVKSRQYRPVARDQDFAKALSEMTFQQSGNVADDQLIRFGRALGAALVCFASINQFSDLEFRISYKMIDVASGEILDMSSETVRTGVSGLLDATDNIAKKLFGDEEGTSSDSGGMLNEPLLPITSQPITVRTNSSENARAQNTIKTVAIVPITGGVVRQSVKDDITEIFLKGVDRSRQYRNVSRGRNFRNALSQMVFQRNGNVSDDQLIRFGKTLGADLVFIATVQQFSEMEYRIIYRMIDVASITFIERGEPVDTGVLGLLRTAENIAQTLFGDGS